MKLNEIFKIDKYSQAYDYALSNDFLIQEIQPNEQGERQFQIIQQLALQTEDDDLQVIRARREQECFSVVNRGKVWYNKLSKEQEEELAAWYEAWLEAPEKKVVPIRPTWII